MTFKNILFLIWIAVSLAGCGGSSGSNKKSEPENPTITEPTTPSSDNTPDVFSFAAQSNVELDSWITSESITITGLGQDISADVTAGGLEFSINGGDFSAQPATISNGQTLRVRILSSSSYSSTRTASIMIGSETVNFSVTTLASEEAPPVDITPDVFTFPAIIDAELNDWVISEIVTISGLNAAATVSKNGDLQFSIDDAPFVSTNSIITNGQTLQVRALSSGNYETLRTPSITVGTETVTFAVTTKLEPIDIEPDTFSFTTKSGVAFDTWIESEEIMVSGINSVVDVSSEGLQFSIEGSPFTPGQATIENGESIKVRIRSGSSFSETLTGTLNIGSASATFSVTTLEEDIEPDAFSFTNKIDVARLTWIESEVVTITGINSAVAIYSNSLEYSINGSDFKGGTGQIENNQTLKVRVLSNSGFDRTATGTLMVGDTSVYFSVTTLEGIPTLTNISLTDDSTLEEGGFLKAQVECSHCEPDMTEYTWSIESDGEQQIIATGDTYTVEAAHIAKEISVKAKAINSAGVPGNLLIQKYALNRVKKIFSNEQAFAALKTDGSLITWGPSAAGGDSSAVNAQLTSGVKEVYANNYAFAAIKEDGSVVAWGFDERGGNIPAETQTNLTNVTAITASSQAFAALKEDGSVVVWGNSGSGGSMYQSLQDELFDVTAIVSHPLNSRFAALRSDGSIVKWGSVTAHEVLNVNANTIYANHGAFAALSDSGEVITFGADSYGGNGSHTVSGLDSGVTSIAFTERAFAALKDDGSVIAWGNASYGGDSSTVASSALDSDVAQIFATENAFAALKQDGAVVAWGTTGGYVPPYIDVTNIKNIKPAGESFVAIKHDGSAVSWGASWADSLSSVRDALSSGVVDIFPASLAAAALKDDGSLVVWGSSAGAGEPNSNIRSQISSGVIDVYSTNYAFAALKEDGQVVLWGHSTYGGAIEEPMNLEPEGLIVLETIFPL